MGYQMTARAVQDVQNTIIDLMPTLRRFARSLTGSPDAADHLVQAAYERALSSPQAWLAGEHPASWMRGIVRNLWADQNHSSRDRPSAPLESSRHVAVEDTGWPSSANLTLAQVRSAVAALSEEQGCALMLVCVDGLTYQEAAAKLDIPIGTLMARLCRGRLELGRRMSVPNAGTTADNPESGHTVARSAP
jgi:RNA polymerase sigma-70 factor, ECF subfamily